MQACPGIQSGHMGNLSEEPTVTEWLNGVRIMHRAHLEASKSSWQRHRVLGSLAATAGIVSATAVFANLTGNPKTWVQVVAGSVAVGAVALTVIHTFLNYAGEAASHQSASAGYGALRREIEQRKMICTVDDNFLTFVRTTWDRLDQQSPQVPPRTYDRVSQLTIGERHKQLPRRRWNPSRSSGT